MSSASCQVDIENEIAVLTLLRPYCLNIAGKRDLTETVKGLAEDQSVRALIVTSSHPQAWLVDVAELANMPPAETRAFSEAGHVLVDALSNLSFPTIAAVNSPALGGGCELAVACDLLYAGKDAQFGQIECLGGVIPGFGGTWRLVQRVGMSRAMEMIFTAEVLSADQAQEINLILEVVRGERLLDHCRDIAHEDQGYRPICRFFGKASSFKRSGEGVVRG